jgi:hypothetical protein
LRPNIYLLEKMTPKFQATIIDGRIKLSRGEGALYKDYLLTLEGKDVQITIEKYRHTMSEQQRRYYFAVVVKMIADDTGQDYDTIHEFLKHNFAPRKKITIKKGVAQWIPQCTHELFREDVFDHFIEPVRAWASSELGIVIPDPNQVSP